MSENPASEQDIRPYWWRVDRLSPQDGPDGWRECCRGSSAVLDIEALAETNLNGHDDRPESMHRIRVYENSSHSGDPLIERVRQARVVPVVPPEAELPESAFEEKSLPQRTPETPPPPLRDQPAEPVSIDTLERLIAHLKATVTAPGYDPGEGYVSPPLAIPVDQLPPELADLLHSAFNRFVREAGGRPATPTEENLLKCAGQLTAAMWAAQQEAKLRRGGTAWAQHPELQDAMAAACTLYIAAWVTSKLEG